MNKMRRSLRREDGVAAVEFALIFSVLAMLLFGVIEFGRVYSQWQVFQGAAREGARCAAVQAGEAAVGLPVCDVQTAVTSAAGAYTPSMTNFAVSVSGGGSVCTADTIGQEVTVSWDQPFDINIPFWSDVQVTGTMEGTFRCE